MQLETAYFGVVELNERDFILFPEGIPGFEEYKKFALIGNDETVSSSFFFLQSVENKDLCFVVTDPFMVYANYEVNVDDEDVELLQITDPNSVMTLAIVVIPEDIKQMRVNLKAPVIINIEKKLGKQIIQKDESLPVRYYLHKE
ncbi:MAG: flagellar assembly protein FliW [Clostridiaceae bacterium]|nr:flagellar assembly protein FliW [Clostridiaceae bacterium]